MYFAKITRHRRLFDKDFGADLREAIAPELERTRYNKTWRFSKPVLVDDHYLAGKLGFTHVGQERRTEYDEAAQDFVTVQGPARQTAFSHFVVDLRTEVLVFEERGRDVRRQAFIGAFKALLAEADFPAEVELLTDPTSLREWASRVDRVVSVSAVVFDPNPGWVEDAGAIRELVEDTNARSADVTLKAADDDSLNVDSPPIRGAFEQISREGQGKMAAVGVRGDRTTRWNTGQRVRSDVVDLDSADDHGVIWRRLMARLRENL